MYHPLFFAEMESSHVFTASTPYPRSFGTLYMSSIFSIFGIPAKMASHLKNKRKTVFFPLFLNKRRFLHIFTIHHPLLKPDSESPDFFTYNTSGISFFGSVFKVPKIVLFLKWPGNAV